MIAPNSTRLPASPVSREFIESKIDFLMDTHLWPSRQKLDARAWLTNFLPDERPLALNMLNVFLYYNDDIVNALFFAAVHQLSVTVTASATSLSQAARAWTAFLRHVLITYVEDDPSNPTASGVLFARKARQVLRISETQITTPAAVLRALVANPSQPVLLVDDFLGTGEQIADAWNRPYALDDATTSSLSDAARAGAYIAYVPLVATHRGVTDVQPLCQGLHVHPTHVLTDEYSLASPASILWPPSLKPKVANFLLAASSRAGIVEALGPNWKGFHSLALPLAFSHGVPDATLPLYYWERNGWIPLISRT